MTSGRDAGMGGGPGGRDLRIDFFRGLALIMIFVDHIPGNRLASLTLKNFGFIDAAEVFVFLAGFSAVLAYSRCFDGDGFQPGALRVGRRICEIYYWHLAVLGGSFVLLYTAFEMFGDPGYLNDIGMWEFVFSPAEAVAQAMALKHQPNMLNILPLYIVLLAWFPVMFWLLRRNPWLALGVSFAIWAVANLVSLNLPSTLEVTGWVFNPFAWQLLFTLGAFAADRVGTSRVHPPAWLLAAAAAYVLFAFLVAAPWTWITGPDTRLISADMLGQMDKSYLSLWRVTHLLALACIVGFLVEPRAGWLQKPLARGVIWSGRQSLEVFCLGTILSFAGWVVLNEAGAGLLAQVAVTAAGIGVMTTAAWILEQRKRARDGASRSGSGDAPVSSSFGYSQRSSAGPG